MEGRKLNISYNKSGNGYLTPKLSLPKSDLEDMGVIPEDREINYSYNNQNKIMFLSKESLEDYEIIIKKKAK